MQMGRRRARNNAHLLCRLCLQQPRIEHQLRLGVLCILPLGLQLLGLQQRIGKDARAISARLR